MVSAHVHEAKATGARSRIEISGTEGDLALVSTGPLASAGIQIGGLRLLAPDGDGGYEELDVPARFHRPIGLTEYAERYNVAQTYAALAADLRSGERTVPDFDSGVRLHRLLGAIRHSANTGTRVDA